MKVYCGIDNGCSGSLAVIYSDGKVDWTWTPVKKEMKQTKKLGYISRINHPELIEWLGSRLNGNCFVAMERPALDPNPMRFSTTVSAARSFESTLIALETLKLPYEVFDSRAWQKEMLPEGCKGAALKTAACQVARRLFPNLGEKHDAYRDADGLLLAEWARRKGF